MKSLKTSVAIAALAIATVVGAAAAADDPPPGPGPGSMMQGWGGGWGPRGGGYGFMGPGMMGFGGMGPWMMGQGGSPLAMCEAMGSRVEGRIAFLKAELKITADQESLWKTYADAARDNSTGMVTRCTAMMTQRASGAALTLPERLDLHEQFMTSQLESMRAVNGALKPLYAALSDDQKKVADQVFWTPMGMM